MSNPLSRVTTRVAYGASQLPRIAWYVGHSLAVRRLSEAAQRRDGKKVRPRAHTNLPVPDRRRLYADMAILLQDLANIEAGLYPLPADHDKSLLTLLRRSPLFARALKPGGRLVLVDSLQRGDQPDYERLLELFPQNYHEPYFRSYTNEDFGTLAAGCGLTHIRDVKAFVSKVTIFD